jgi:hypothetical protein
MNYNDSMICNIVNIHCVHTIYHRQYYSRSSSFRFTMRTFAISALVASSVSLSMKTNQNNKLMGVDSALSGISQLLKDHVPKKDETENP